MSPTIPTYYTVANVIAANEPMTPAGIARAIARAHGSARGVAAAIASMVAAGEIVMVAGRCHTPAPTYDSGRAPSVRTQVTVTGRVARRPSEAIAAANTASLAMLAEIARRLPGASLPGAVPGSHWGHAGDADYIRARLAELLAGMVGDRSPREMDITTDDGIVTVTLPAA